jgi:predicted transcriptional regulator
MATIMIRSSYALDVETVRRLEALARSWNVSKSEALRRAIRVATEGDSGSDALAALDALQKSLHLAESEARQWERRVHAERRARRPVQRRN